MRKLGINCVKLCVYMGVKLVSKYTQHPQPTEQENYQMQTDPHYPQPITKPIHGLSSRLSTGQSWYITDTKAVLTTLST